MQVPTSSLEAEADQTRAEWFHNLISSVVIYPLIVSEDQLLEHLPALLLLVLLPEHLPRPQAVLVPVGFNRVLPDFIHGVNIVLFDELHVRLFLLLDVSRDAYVGVSLLPGTFFILLHPGSKANVEFLREYDL